MSYAIFESSTQNADPIFKLLFTVGDLEFRYTNAAHIIGDSNGSFIPAQISSGDFTNSSEFNRSILPLKFPRTNELAQQFIGGVPEQVTNVTIWRQHLSDTDEEFRVFWQGRIVGVSIDNDKVEIECESIFSQMKRTGLYRRYQRGCPYDIYGEGCYVDKYDYAEPLTITAISGSILTVPGADSFEDGFFSGGEIETENGLRRFIVAHVGGSLTLSRAIVGLEDLEDSSGEINAIFYPGCNHSIDHCKNKFNNLPNHGAFPYTPPKNPFNEVSMY